MSVRALFPAVTWLALYLTAVLAPLVVLLLGDSPGGAGFWWDFAIAIGFAGLSMIGIQFYLTARFRRASAPFGIDILYYFHRYVAVIAFLLVVLHATIVLWLNPSFLDSFDPRSAPGYMFAGVVSAAALAILVTSSLWRKPLRIPYDGWRILHAVLAVAAVVLALIHVQGVGYYIATPRLRMMWLLIMAAWVALLCYVRILKPLNMRRRPYRVSAVRADLGSAWTVALEPVGHPGFSFQPGQFAWLTLRHSPFAMKEHPFSISSAPAADGKLEFTIKELGDFTRRVGETGVGETAYVDGPYGAFSIDRYPDAPGFVFIGGGIGLAPLISMLRALHGRRDPRPVLLIAANSRWDRVPFREAISELTRAGNRRFVHVLEEPEPDWQGERGRVTTAMLDRHLPTENRGELEYFLCGPQPMISAVEHSLYELGVPLVQSHSELFDLV